MKGDIHAGVPIEVDPLFGTDCTAPLVPGASVLVFAFPGGKKAPVTSACGSRLASTFFFDGKDHHPAREVTELLSSLPSR